MPMAVCHSTSAPRVACAELRAHHHPFGSGHSTDTRSRARRISIAEYRHDHMNTAISSDLLFVNTVLCGIRYEYRD